MFIVSGSALVASNSSWPTAQGRGLFSLPQKVTGRCGTRWFHPKPLMLMSDAFLHTLAVMTWLTVGLWPPTTQEATLRLSASVRTGAASGLRRETSFQALRLMFIWPMRPFLVPHGHDGFEINTRSKCRLQLQFECLCVQISGITDIFISSGY